MRNIKTTLLRCSLIHLIFVLSITLTFFSCNDDGTDDLSSNTLLKSLDKTIWELKEDDGDMSYYKFYDNISNPLEQWHPSGVDCYEHSFRAIVDDITILENSSSVFSMKAINRDNRQVVLSFSKSGDNLKIEIDKGERLTVYMSRTSVEAINELTICN